MNKKIYQNLVKLSLLFQGRPHHFIKFLIDNDAFNKKFLDDVETSKKLNDELRDNFFYNMGEMEDYYNSILTEKEIDSEEEYNKKLWTAIKSEKYEEAAKIRDYMIKNSIKNRIDKNF
jgi:hypothetical protein